MKIQSIKTQLTHLTLIALMITAISSVTHSSSSFAHEGEHDHDAKPTASSLKDNNHSIQGLILPGVVFNSLQLAYEYKVTPKLGIRADGLLILSLGGSALAGALGLSYIPVEGHSDSASHGLELGLGVVAGVGGPGNCDTSVNDCSSGPFQLVKGFVGYRYQKFSGFQLRAGLAPLMSFKGELEAILPEFTLGVAF